MGIITEKELKTKYLTKEEACKYLNVSDRTICRYLSKGNIETIKIKKYKYINKKDLENFYNDFIKNK